MQASGWAGLHRQAALCRGPLSGPYRSSVWDRHAWYLCYAHSLTDLERKSEAQVGSGHEQCQTSRCVHNRASARQCTYNKTFVPRTHKGLHMLPPSAAAPAPSCGSLEPRRGLHASLPTGPPPETDPEFLSGDRPAATSENTLNNDAVEEKSYSAFNKFQHHRLLRGKKVVRGDSCRNFSTDCQH